MLVRVRGRIVSRSCIWMGRDFECVFICVCARYGCVCELRLCVYVCVRVCVMVVCVLCIGVGWCEGG